MPEPLGCHQGLSLADEWCASPLGVLALVSGYKVQFQSVAAAVQGTDRHTPAEMAEPWHVQILGSWLWMNSAFMWVRGWVGQGLQLSSLFLSPLWIPRV